jgi:hypothetical protein
MDIKNLLKEIELSALQQEDPGPTRVVSFRIPEKVCERIEKKLGYNVNKTARALALPGLKRLAD